MSARTLEQATLRRHGLHGGGAAATRVELHQRRWLVLAPHPDDETLGSGQLICTLADAGRPPQVVFLTDGAASHPDSPTWPPSRLAARRRREACAALLDLMGPRSPPPLFLGWPDADPWREGEAAFERTVRRLAGLMRRARLSAIAATWAHEPHCDHVAAAALAGATADRVRPRPDVYAYLVWGWEAPEAAGLATRPAVVLPASAHHRWARRRALARHRSQLGALITDCPHAFRLPPFMAQTLPGAQLLLGPERR